MSLPTDAAARKAIPVYSGFVKYFPDAMAAVAQLSMIANEQHNPGQPLGWDRSKSSDELDALMRHTLDRAKGETFDTDGVRHATKRAWRAMADLQKEIEADSGTYMRQDVERVDAWVHATANPEHFYQDLPDLFTMKPVEDVLDNLSSLAGRIQAAERSIEQRPAWLKRSTEQEHEQRDTAKEAGHHYCQSLDC